MDKPPKHLRTEIFYKYNEVVDYIEDKYNISTEDYAHSMNHFPNWLKLFGEKEPTYPRSMNGVCRACIDGCWVEITKEQYIIAVREFQEQFQRYKVWKKDNPEPPYLNFWKWIVGNNDIRNGSFMTIDVKEYLKHEETPIWVQSILQLMYNEFNEDTMTFLMEW